MKLNKMTLGDIAEQFARIPSEGFHVRCTHCNSIFSDMSSFPDYIKLAMMQSHLNECEEFKKWNS